VSLEIPRIDGHEVARVPAYRADKAYRCPGCQNPIPPGTGHVVAWPQDLVDDRRHWHLHCWRLAVRSGRV
jgi:hypothetical protein